MKDLTNMLFTDKQELLRLYKESDGRCMNCGLPHKQSLLWFKRNLRPQITRDGIKIFCGRCFRDKTVH